MPDSDLKPIEIAAQDGTAGAAASAIRNLGQVKGAVEGLQGAMAQLSGASGSATSTLESAFSKIAGKLAGGALVVGLFATIKNARDSLAELGDRSEDLRLPAQLLNDMGLAAAQARVPVDKLNESMKFFAEVSKKDAEEAKDFYTALGNINQASAVAFKNAKTQEERLRIVGDAFRSTTDEVKRAQLGLQAFNTDNERALSVLAAGSAGLDEFKARAAALGVVIDEAMIRKSQDAQASMNVLATVLRDRVNIGVTELWQGVTSLVPDLKGLGETFGIATGPGRTFAEMIRATRVELANLSAWAEIAAAVIKNPFDSAARGAAIASALAKRETFDIKNNFLGLDAGLNDIGKKIEATARGAFKPRPKLNEEEGGEDAFGRAESQIRKRIALTDAETSTIGQNTAARERAKVVAELEEAAKRANIAAGEKNTEVTNEQRASIERLADAMAAATERQRRMKDQWEGINETFRYFGNVAGEAFDRLFDKTKSWGDFAVSTARNVAREMFNAALMGTGAFAKMFGTNSGSGGVGGIIGGIVSAFAGGGNPTGWATNPWSGAGAMAVPTFAGGGTIPAGGLALVSEHKRPRFLRAGSEPITVTPGEPGGGGQPIMISISLDGANGDEAVRRMAFEASQRAMQQALAQVPGIVVKTQAQSWRTQ